MRGVRRTSDFPGFSPPESKLKAKDLRRDKCFNGDYFDTELQMPVASQSIFAVMNNLKSSKVLQLALPVCRME